VIFDGVGDDRVSMCVQRKSGKRGRSGNSEAVRSRRGRCSGDSDLTTVILAGSGKPVVWEYFEPDESPSYKAGTVE